MRNVLALRKEQSILPAMYLSRPDHRYVPNMPSCVFLGHRGIGKTFGAIATVLVAVKEFLSHKTLYTIGGDVDSYNPTIILMAPTREQGRKIFWPELISFMDGRPGVTIDNHRLAVKFYRPSTKDHITIFLMSSSQHDKLRGMKVDLAIIDEAQLATKAVMTSISSAVLRKRGFIMLIGTAKKDSLLHTEIKLMAKEPSLGKYVVIPTEQTTVWTKEQEEAELKRLGINMYNQEYRCVFYYEKDATFYGSKLAELEANVPHYKEGIKGFEPIIMAADIGVGKGNAAWLCQVRQGSVHIIGYYDDYEDISDMAKDISEDGHKVAHIILPHDGNHKLQGQKMKKRSLYENAFPDAKIAKEVPKTGNKMVSINNVLASLELMRWCIDTTPLLYGVEVRQPEMLGVHKGYELLKIHAKKVDNEGNSMDVIDKKTGADHAADAFETLVSGLRIYGGSMVGAGLPILTQPDNSERLTRKYGRGRVLQNTRNRW